MNMIKKIIAAALSASLVLILMCGCSGNEDAQYEHLKTDIVGIWMDENGPTVDSNNIFGDSLRFYEFTSAGEVYYHYIFINGEEEIPTDGAVKTSTYYFDGNMIVNVVENSEDGTTQKTGAIIEINDGNMTMSNDSGSTRYKKLSVEDATGYAVFYKDEELRAQQDELINTADVAGDGSEGGETETSGGTAALFENTATEASEVTADSSDTESVSETGENVTEE